MGIQNNTVRLFILLACFLSILISPCSCSSSAATAVLRIQASSRVILASRQGSNYSQTNNVNCRRAAQKASSLQLSMVSDVGRTSATTSGSLLLLSLIRGGAKNNKKKAGGRSANLFSATGQKKVGAAKQEKKSAVSETFEKYKAILPLTRVYISLVGICTLAGLVLGDEVTMALLSLDPTQVLYGWQLWRPITAATFLGPPSISWLMSAYYLFEYGSSLERAYGTAQHVIFLVCQIVTLSILSSFFGIPFFANSVITAMLHVLSRSMPNEKVKWLIFTVPYWALPYGLMASDVLQQQGNLSAAMPHVLGILSGHFYFFHKFIWPKKQDDKSEADWLVPPQFLIDSFNPNFRSKKEKEKIKGRQKGKGRKLGR